MQVIIHKISTMELIQALLLQIEKGHKYIDVTAIKTEETPNTISIKPSVAPSSSTDTEQEFKITAA